jgi:hypothetical protein
MFANLSVLSIEPEMLRRESLLVPVTEASDTIVGKALFFVLLAGTNVGLELSAPVVCCILDAFFFCFFINYSIKNTD